MITFNFATGTVRKRIMPPKIGLAIALDGTRDFPTICTFCGGGADGGDFILSYVSSTESIALHVSCVRNIETRLRRLEEQNAVHGT